MHSADVHIRGSGPVACALALALGQQGLRVALTAPAAPVASGADVRAYALNDASRSLLRRLRVWDALPVTAATPVLEMQVFGDAQGAELDFSAFDQGSEALAWIVDAAELDAALRDALRFAAGVQLVDTAVAAELTVLAEGRDSASRAAFGVGFERHPYGQVAIATRLVGERPHGHIATQWFRAPDVLALLPLDRPEPSRSYALVWSLPEERAAALATLDDAAFDRELAAATGGACGSLHVTAPRVAWPLQLGRADRVCGAGWALVGDAAHVVHPLAGQGLNLGLADVQALADVLGVREAWRSPGDERLLRRYARARALPTEAMSALTDALLHTFAIDQPLLRELRNRGLTLVNRVGPVKRWLTARALGH